ncbi:MULTISPECIES: hypothetical protein [Apibacter]|uniref:hypothetical protein n=1 Tax=Apibacter TaxID=1778601 RepID=UPI0013205BF9|nr:MULTISPECIES: hypothetical protein [Apibacter]MXO32989.1 hypothetical protein [Apibacter sp. B2912]MXO35079.1 hypothetical protein [Apibacter sp. B3883]MXO42437.1 hypothetical protein [Apibacter sp. B3889]MXP04454.1 hypothetical protein [Apibacter sp. B3887]MXP08365.1 hypothetical protein [Apibacter sp. B3935]
MKKIVLPFIIFNLITLQSCKNNQKTSITQEVTQPNTPALNEDLEIKVPEDKAREILNQDIPKFSDAIIQNFLIEYKSYIDQYINAADVKDLNKLTELTKKNQKLIITRKIITEELSSNPKELNKFNDYVRKLDSMAAEVMNK